MKPAIYIETTIVSYLAARPARDPFLLGCQRLTRRWWRERRRGYELLSSTLVAQEASRGETMMARRRIRLLSETMILDVSTESDELAARIRENINLPDRAAADAAHIALAAVNGAEFLLTWNCTHIANPHFQRILHRVCASCGYDLPALVTPLTMFPPILP